MDPLIACSRWLGDCLLCRDSRLSGCFGWLAYTCAAGVKEFHVNQLKPWPAWCENPTWPKRGGGKPRCCQSCSCRRRRRGGSHLSERKASCSRPPGPQFCSVEAGRLLSRLAARGEECKGAKNPFHQYVTDLLKTAVPPAHHSSLPCDGTNDLKKGPELFYQQVVIPSPWSVTVAFGSCGPAPLDVSFFVVSPRTVWANNVNRM